MLASIATILGALTGLAPMLLQFLSMKANNAHQLALEQLRIEAAKIGTALQIDLANVQADVRQYDHIYDFANAPTGVRWIDALAVFVRPYITLVMFHIWVLIEVGLFVAAVNGGLDLAQVVGIIWDETTKAIFGSIMGFWFGNRASMRGTKTMAATAEVSATASPAVAPVARAAASTPAARGRADSGSVG